MKARKRILSNGSADDPSVSPALTAPLAELARLLGRHSNGDGIHPTPIAGVAVLRASTPMAEAIHAIHEPAMCLVVQGAKQVILNDVTYAYDASHYLVVSLELPITGRVTRAVPDAPYLCFRMDLDPGEIASLILQTGMRSAPDRGVCRALALAQTTVEMLDAVLRLTRLLDTPDDIDTLAPLAKREILYRLLKGEQGPQLRQIAATDGQAHRISRAIGWLKKHFDQPLRIEDIAHEVHMSPSSFHHHFKAITTLSPLQYQKQLRLQEARRLMLVHDVDAATAGHRVGYESPSQFGREYSRLFGAPPARDLRRLREQLPVHAAGAAAFSGL
jgi:AraC-like DNA-binding protein